MTSSPTSASLTSKARIQPVSRYLTTSKSRQQKSGRSQRKGKKNWKTRVSKAQTREWLTLRKKGARIRLKSTMHAFLPALRKRAAQIRFRNKKTRKTNASLRENVPAAQAGTNSKRRRGKTKVPRTAHLRDRTKLT